MSQYIDPETWNEGLIYAELTDSEVWGGEGGVDYVLAASGFSLGLAVAPSGRMMSLAAAGTSLNLAVADIDTAFSGERSAVSYTMVAEEFPISLTMNNV